MARELEADGQARRVLTAFAVISGGLAVYAVRRADPDLFGYLLYGRLFLQEGSATVADPFAYTSGGRTWVTFEYLAQILLWVVFDQFGELGLIGLKCLLGGLAAYLLYASVRQLTDNALVWVPVFVLCVVPLSRYFIFRPQLFTFDFFALFILVIFRFAQRHTAPLWLLPPAALLWANMHGGFVAGLGALVVAIVICWLQEGEDHRGMDRLTAVRPLIWTLAACLVATFLNPNGASVWRYVLTELAHGTNRRYIQEWQPISLTNDPWSGLALAVIVITLCLTGWLVHQQHVRVLGLKVWQWMVLNVPVIVVAYGAVRNVPLAVVWLAPILTLFLSALATSNRTASFRRVWLWLATSALIAAVLVVMYVAEQPRPRIQTGANALGSTHPCGAVEFMRLNGLTGHVYNPLWWGSYISWKLYPAVKVSMDGRNISLFSRDTVLENLRFYARDVNDAETDAPLRYDTDFLLVPSDSAVLGTILADGHWHQLYANDDARLFVRSDPAHESLISAARSGSLTFPVRECTGTLSSK